MRDNKMLKYLQMLFAQDWPNLCWGRFNTVEVYSINTLQGKI